MDRLEPQEAGLGFEHRKDLDALGDEVVRQATFEIAGPIRSTIGSLAATAARPGDDRLAARLADLNDAPSLANIVRREIDIVVGLRVPLQLGDHFPLRPTCDPAASTCHFYQHRRPLTGGALAGGILARGPSWADSDAVSNLRHGLLK